MLGLNPYYTGSYSMSLRQWRIFIQGHWVLILIILEVTLWDSGAYELSTTRNSLNPYYTGSYSMSFWTKWEAKEKHEVLILIILEVTLWEKGNIIFNGSFEGLNPYYTGSYSMSATGHFVDIWSTLS